jgi:hypothetical protein
MSGKPRLESAMLNLPRSFNAELMPFDMKLAAKVHTSKSLKDFFTATLSDGEFSKDFPPF